MTRDLALIEPSSACTPPLSRTASIVWVLEPRCSSRTSGRSPPRRRWPALRPPCTASRSGPFPPTETTAAGISCADSLGRIDVDAIGTTVVCGGVEVNPGDLVLGDYDGVVIIPSALREEVVRLAEEKVAGENLVREKLADGMPVSEAFRTYGVI
jgi:Aldolase/RraA